MEDRNWNALKRIVESDGFVKPAGFDSLLGTPLKKAVAVKVTQLCSGLDPKSFSLAWFQDVCQRLGVKAEGAKRETYLKDALLKLYHAEKDQDFWEEVRTARKKHEEEKDQKTNDLGKFYFDLRRSSSSERLEKLVSYFAADGSVDDRLKEFRKQFGIKAGGGTKTKLLTRLKNIAKELSERDAAHGFR